MMIMLKHPALVKVNLGRYLKFNHLCNCINTIASLYDPCDTHSSYIRIRVFVVSSDVARPFMWLQDQ